MSARDAWHDRHRRDAGRPLGPPSAWVMAHALALPRDAMMLDVAAGRGRHAIPLAHAGHRVVALDVDELAVRDARAAAPALAALVADSAWLPIRDACIDAVLCVHYLDRALLRDVGRLLRPNGVVLVETFTTAQRTLGRGPSSPEHLLEPDELAALLAGLSIREYGEMLVRDAWGERYVARAVAVNPAPVAR